VHLSGPRESKAILGGRACRHLGAAVTTALVLAGGGVAGIAWETGVLRGIEEVAPELAATLAAADRIIGTSAGSTVGAQVTGGVPLADLYEQQVRGPSPEIDVDVPIADLFEQLSGAARGAATVVEACRRIGALAAQTPTVDEATRRAVIARRLPRHAWPAADLRIVAVDVETGEARVFDRHSGVGLVDAVAASCAVPGVWPPATIDGRRYIDGGTRSSANADLAAGCDRVLVLSPGDPDLPSLSGIRLAEEVATLAPAEVTVLHADAGAVAAFGANPLATATRRPAAEAGRRQGRAWAARLVAIWGR